MSVHPGSHRVPNRSATPRGSAGKVTLIPEPALALAGGREAQQANLLSPGNFQIKQTCPRNVSADGLGFLHGGGLLW